jgi:hypothetical protein
LSEATAGQWTHFFWTYQGQYGNTTRNHAPGKAKKPALIPTVLMVAACTENYFLEFLDVSGHLMQIQHHTKISPERFTAYYLPNQSLRMTVTLKEMSRDLRHNVTVHGPFTVGVTEDNVL